MSLAYNFSLQYYPYIKQLGHENKGNDHQLKKLLIVKQILLFIEIQCNIPPSKHTYSVHYLELYNKLNYVSILIGSRSWFMIYWRTDAWMASPLTNFCFVIINKFHVAVSLYKNRSQKTSICGKYFSDTLDRASCAICLVFTTF